MKTILISTTRTGTTNWTAQYRDSARVLYHPEFYNLSEFVGTLQSFRRRFPDIPILDIENKDVFCEPWDHVLHNAQQHFNLPKDWRWTDENTTEFFESIADNYVINVHVQQMIPITEYSKLLRAETIKLLNIADHKVCLVRDDIIQWTLSKYIQRFQFDNINQDDLADRHHPDGDYEIFLSDKDLFDLKSIFNDTVVLKDAIEAWANAYRMPIVNTNDIWRDEHYNPRRQISLYYTDSSGNKQHHREILTNHMKTFDINSEIQKLSRAGYYP